MPNSEEGLTFGDFTTEEWEKYFNNSAAQIGNLPPVEFLFDFEYSDHEEQGNDYRAGDAKVQILTSDSSVAAKNVTAGLEDSGVEVGQESEQENTQEKQRNLQLMLVILWMICPIINRSKSKTCQNQLAATPLNKLYLPETALMNLKMKKRKTNLQDVDSFPPLASTVNSQADKVGDKPENERSRKRRKRRRQRKRSGSVSSSSSECGEKERASVNSGGLNTKGKATASLLTTDKVIVSKAVQRKSTSSCDGETVEERKSSSSTEGTSNSPVQSDTDVKITVTVDTSPDPFSSDQTSKALELEKEAPSTVDQCKQTTSTNKVVTDKKEPPKPSKSSWADLFKNSAKPSPGIVIKTASSVLRTETHSASGLKKTEDPVQTTVGVEEDKYAKKFAEIIQKQELNYNQKPYVPRGLINRGNWCYINATLQALAGCSPFFNLLRQLPSMKERGPTSTPILDSFVIFMNEFKELQAKPGSSSKADFNIGESFEPSYVYKMLLVIQSSLSAKGRQEDAQEFLSCILNGMHEEMLQLTKTISAPVKAAEQDAANLSLKANDSAADDELAPEGQEDDGDWEQVGPRNKSMVTRMASYPQSLISDVFGGFLRSSVHQTGLKDSANVEPFFELHLDVQTVTSVEEALKNLVVKEEVQGYTCTKTKAQVDVSRRVTLEGLPKVLILHLKRFIYSKSGSQKLQKVIDYPLELTIGKELLSSNVKNKYSAAQKTYKLFAVVYHHGKNAWGGHYTSDVYHPTHGWIRADDTRLKIVPFNYVLKPTQGKDPYMLFYRRIDLMP
ncbi:Ubiquitin carboxyl-terminal hydrolase 10 [Desmophyllum pertusum]|uniref:Ubiquitin carboxyl-terminal hydrolase n=1 Tax=Desmophyllum pertusum TaxID=174260 RepID=A0A9W9Z4A8_9CNID|nr:Ubiquitin carboxyl-terminal hydrolase 10 [Desmophyllum pertusum]